MAESDLAAFLRAHQDHDSFSPTEEVTALARFLPERQTLALMPENEMQRLRARLGELRKAKGLGQEQITQVEELLKRLA